MTRKRILILGSTGSIGRQTLQIVRQHADRLQVVGLAAGSNAEALRDQARELGVQQVALCDPEAAGALAAPGDLQVHAGPEGLCRLVRESRPDLVVAAVSGGAGLASILAALETGAAVALANKEPLVTAGHLVMDASRRYAAPLLPVDSELSALWQCLRGERPEDVERVLLTASGGPFREASRQELEQVTAEQALAHPTWRMGPKVTVDSATLMNKGFELFEVHWLFGVEFSQIEVVVHPQSVIHSGIRLRDGALLAQLGVPDMRGPIQFALSYPERWEADFPRLELAATGQLTFGEPDEARFPCLRLARQAGESGASYPAALSAADEVAVEAFLAGRLNFAGVPRLIERVLDEHDPLALTGLAEVRQAETWARRRACELLEHTG